MIVVGARCAGAATARLLAARGHDVLVLDRAVMPSDTLSTHGLARGGVVQLSRWGLLDRLVADGRSARADRVVQRPRRPGRAAGQGQRRRRLPARLRGGRASTPCWSRRPRSPVPRYVWGSRSTGSDATATVESSASRHASAVADAPRCCARVTWWRPTGCGRRWRPRSVRAPRSSFRTGATLFYAYVAGVAWRGYEFHIAPGAFAGVFPTHDGEACVWLSRPDRLYGDVRRARGDRADAWTDAADRGRARTSASA